MNLMVLRQRSDHESPAVASRLSGLSTINRNVAGTIGTSLAVQASLLVNGVATARILGVLDRGHSALLGLLATVVPILATMGLPLAITYWIAQDPHLARRLLISLRRTLALQLLTLMTVHALVLLVIFNGAPTYVQVAAGVSLLGSPAIALWTYGMAILQANQQFRALNVSRIVSPPIGAALTVTFLATGVRGLLIITVTWVTLYWLTAVITGIAAIRGLAASHVAEDRTALPAVGTLLRFGGKALLGSVTPLEGFQLDQAIVGIFISQRALGIYVVGVAFTNLPRFVSQSIGMVAYPHIAAGRKTQGLAREILAFAAMTLILCGGTIIAIQLALPFLVSHLFGAAFAPAVGVARILLISALLFALRRVLSECARGAGRPGLGSVAEVLSIVTLIPAVSLWYSSGARGVAMALVLAAGAGLAGLVVGLVARPRRQGLRWGAAQHEPLATDN